ncbi:MAG: hypothetical protein Fur0035_00970 [Anaerolineales bacterium]
MTLSEKLISEGERALAFFAALTPEQWNAPVYTEGETWTVRSVLAHFVTAERGFLKIFADILAGGPGASDDFDINRYNASQQAKTAALTPAELMENFRQTRAEMAAFAAGLSESDLQKIGRHPALGITSLGEMLKLVYLHNSMHFRDLKKAL